MDVAKRKAVVAAVMFFGVTSIAAAAPAAEIPSAFAIEKSSNKNQVHYAVAVDAECTPAGVAPVHAYWRMFERGPNATEPLLDREQRAYGIASQRAQGSAVHIVLRALPSRPITIQTTRAADGSCTATTTVDISNVVARLHDIYVKQSLFGVDYLLLTGWADSGAVIREKLTL